jgi:formylmethanofuran dehydrogenase subunit B
MGLLERFRRFIWRVEEASNELEYSAIEVIDKAEAVADEHTGGRVGRALEAVQEESRELAERVHLDGADVDPPERPSTR